LGLKKKNRLSLSESSLLCGATRSSPTYSSEQGAIHTRWARRAIRKINQQNILMIDYNSDPLFWQRFLESAGFYRGQLDGDFGEQSHAAADQFEAESLKIAQDLGFFDIRTEGNIQSLQLEAQRKARQFLTDVNEKLSKGGLTFKVIAATRNYGEQNDLFALGRTKPGPIVTRARGGQSNHNFGVAWDIGVFQNGVYLPESDLYKEAGAIGKANGLEWGGDWQGFPDGPHFQAIPETELADLRSAFEAGKSFNALMSVMPANAVV
jgi:peptidoglycan LD-endopeptidase CwlK